MYRLTLILILLLVSFFNTIPARAVSDFFSDSNIQFYDPNACDPSGGDTSVAQQNSPVPAGKVYILGDSITEIAKDKYSELFSSKGWTPTIEGLSSRHIELNNPIPSGLEQIQKDKDIIKNSEAAVIALGTNDQGYSSEEMESKVKKTVNKVRSFKPTIKIYWVNIMDTRNYTRSKNLNKAIARGAGDRADVIDWYGKAKSSANLSSFNEGVHPTKTEDIKLLVDVVYNSVANDTSPDNPEGDGTAPIGGSADGIESSDNSNVSNDTLEGHRLPAVKGGTGYEDPVDSDGKLIAEGVDSKISFPQHVATGQSYQDYYVTMRLPYAKWSWDADTTAIDNEELNWYSSKPRKIIVTNSRTNKSIIAVLAETGPAPWAGARGGQSANGYSSPQRYTPKNYTGRVSGLPPKAIKSIGAKQTENGRGDTLYYAWAPDQNAEPGPTNLRATGDGITGDGGESEGNTACCNTQSPNTETASFSGKDNAEKAINFFVSQGFSKEQAAGIVGNFIQESGVNPESVEIAYSRPPHRSSTIPPSTGPQGQPGYGIAQWTTPSRKDGLKRFSDSINQPVNSLETQLKWVMEEMKNFSGLEEAIKNIKGTGKAVVEQAALKFHNVYEGSSDNASQIRERVNSGWLALRNFSPTAASGEPTGSSGSNVCVCGDTTTSDTGSISTNIQGVIKDAAGKAGGEASVSIASIDGSFKTNTRGDTQKETRSSYKAYVAYGILKAIESGSLSWDKKISGQTVEQHMEKMIVNSDNDSAAILRNRSEFGGPDGLTRILRNEVGLSTKTKMGSGVGGAEDERTTSTANDYVKFLLLLYKKKLPGVSRESYYEKLIGYMKRASTDGGSGRDGIVKGVGNGLEVADKPGWSPSDGPATNDVGIVYEKSKPYVIAILTSNPSPSGWSGVSDIARAAHAAISESGRSSNSCSGAGGDFSSTIKSYAWPDYHSAPYLKRMPAWAAVADDPKSHYVGGAVGGVKGIDCGGFITMTMRNSGLDPEYNPGKGPTAGKPSQMQYLEEKWKKLNIKSTSELQAGDVAINSSHTFMYVGEIDGFNQKFASASYSERGNGRAPMADSGGQAIGAGFSWYRKE